MLLKNQLKLKLISYELWNHSKPQENEWFHSHLEQKNSFYKYLNKNHREWVQFQFLVDLFRNDRLIEFMVKVIDRTKCSSDSKAKTNSWNIESNWVINLKWNKKKTKNVQDFFLRIKLNVQGQEHSLNPTCFCFDLKNLVQVRTITPLSIAR